MDEQTRSILRRCRELGFALAGVAAAAPTRYAEALRAWLARGRHGEMEYLARHEPLLVDPAAFVAGARSIICVADRYHDGAPDASEPASAAARGRIARYARGDDYHAVMKKRLHVLCDELSSAHPRETFRACVDTAPLLEREHAERAGLGAVGKHTLLIDRGLGSWLLLGEIVTTLTLDPTPAAAPDPCGTCTRCLDACPTGAIEPWSVDATKCISYLTIEHRGPIDARFHEAIDDWIFGCDICQEVCPHNQPTARAVAAPRHEAYAPRLGGFDLLDVLGWDADDRSHAFARSALGRAKLAMMKRNAIIAAGNALRRGSDPPLRARLDAIARDETEDGMVRATAREVIAAISPKP